MKFNLFFDKARKRWWLDYTISGKRCRPTFKTKELAVAEQGRIEKEARQNGEDWATRPAHERDEIMRLVGDVEREGGTIAMLRELWENRGSPSPTGHKFELGKSFATFMEEKTAARLSKRSIKAFKSNVGRFVTPRAQMLVSAVTRDDILTHLKPYTARTFNSYLISLKTFFGWCVHTDRISKSPAEKIDLIDKKRMPDIDEPPVILSAPQAGKLLAATLVHDRGLVPYVAVGLFGGLRPDKEAAKLAKADVDSRILVRGAHAKDRQRRYVGIHPTLAAWLKLGGDYCPKNLRRRFERVRARAGLIEVQKVEKSNGKTGKKIVWVGYDQDCLRHSFASHYLPVFGPEKAIAQLGHGDYEMLFGHYRALVTPEDAAAYWKLTPKRCIRMALITALRSRISKP